MTLHSYPINKPISLPKRGSWPAAVHAFDEASVHALMAAEAAERPLLIQGEPGTGKSQLARAVAEATQRLFLSVVVNARTECQDLQWQFDAVARLGEAQALAHFHADEITGRLLPRRFLTPGPLWWVFDWVSAQAQYEQCPHPLEAPPTCPDGWEPSRGSVLLIDEIDKADTDLPNGLLETLGNGDFAVPYLGASVRQSQDCPPPLVIITTNEERELPAAFRRRCLVLPLSLPEADDELLDFLYRRGAVHFEARCADAVRRKAGQLLLEDRKVANAQGLPPPGQAEYLDLLRAVCKLGHDESEQMDWLVKIGKFVLKKASALPR
ncbi:MAG: AAA family ATPase [Candidatus Competibacter sp.]|nr:AAA family ATPase [Candidatus Competibacter sp.]